MVGWVLQHRRELTRADTRPTVRQWMWSLLVGAGMFVFLSVLGLYFGGRGVQRAVVVMMSVAAVGMALSGFVGRNVGNALGRSRGAAALVQLLTALACLIVGGAMLGPARLVVALGDSPMLPLAMMLAMSIVMNIAMRNPESDKAMCAGCSYPFIEENSPERCPECGGYWLRAGGRKLPRAGFEPRLRARAIAAMVVVGALLLVPAFGPGLLMPTFYLRWVATSDTFRADPAFQELSTRTLSPGAVRELSEHLLDMSKRDIRTPYFGMAWLEGLATGGGLPADLSERYFAEMRTPVLRASTPMQVGATGAAIVGFARRAQIAPRDDAYAVVRAISVFGANGMELASRPWNVGGVLAPTAATLASPLPFVAIGGSQPLEMRAAFPNVEFVPGAPGRYVVRAEVWVAVLPPGAWANWKPAVNERGETSVPVGTLWSKKYVLEETVEVR